MVCIIMNFQQTATLVKPTRHWSDRFVTQFNTYWSLGIKNSTEDLVCIIN